MSCSSANLRCRLREPVIVRSLPVSSKKLGGSTEISGRKKKCLLLPRQSSDSKAVDRLLVAENVRYFRAAKAYRDSILTSYFRFARDPGAIPSLAALIATCAALDAEAWMITR
jgi:hypothetical protein